MAVTDPPLVVLRGLEVVALPSGRTVVEPPLVVVVVALAARLTTSWLTNETVAPLCEFPTTYALAPAANPAALLTPPGPLSATPPPVGATSTLFCPKKLKVPVCEFNSRLPLDTATASTLAGPGAVTALSTLASWMLAVPDARSKTTGPCWSLSTNEPPKGLVRTA